jgi:hypothetical protein
MKPVELIYLACPFRHSDPFVQRKRCAAAHFIAAQLSLEGKHVFSPLTHNELLIDIIQDAVPGEQWMQLDLAILSHCKYLYILKMDGWKLSKGVERETLFAMEKGISIHEIDAPDEKLYLPFVRGGSESKLSHL